MSFTICRPSIGSDHDTGLPINRCLNDSVRLIEVDELTDRLQQLSTACELLADGFEGLDEQIARYVACHPAPPRGASGADVDNFLDWLELHEELSDEQQDFVAALRGRHAVELVAVRQRLAHARFQGLLAGSAAKVAELEASDRLCVELNPTHVWSQFETHALLDEDADIPATVLFVCSTRGVRTVVIEEEAEEILRRLETRGSLRVCDLLRGLGRVRCDRGLALLRQLTEVEAIALS
jgi:hypothetical protein